MRDRPLSAVSDVQALRAERAAAGFLVLAFGVTVLARALDPNAFNSDVAWILYAAEQMLDGAALYSDLVDDRPPMLFWLSALPVMLARQTGATPILAFNLTVVLLVGVASALIYRTYRLGWPEATAAVPAYRLALVACFATAAVLYPGFDYGQRENWVFILISPYLFAAASAARGKRLSGGAAYAVGALLGVGLALKPSYLLVWLVVEIWLQRRQPTARAWARPENRALLAVQLLAAAAVLVFAPDYWGMREVATAVSGADGAVGNSWLLARSAAGGVVLALALCWFVRDTAVDREVRSVWLVSVSVFLALALLEGRAWTGAFYPAGAGALLLLALLLLGLVERQQTLADVLRPRAAALPLLALLLLCGYGAVSAGLASFPVWGRGGPQRSLLTELIGAVEDHGWRRPLYLMSSSTTPSFPLVNLTGARWSSRFCCLGVLPGFYSDEERASQPFPYRARDEMSERERYVVDSVVFDLQASPPTLLIVERRPDEWAFPSSGFDYLDYFRRDPRFTDFLREYRPVKTVGPFRIYRRGAPGG